MARETTLNLVLNGDGETGPLSNHFPTQVAPSLWTTSGGFDAIEYSIGGPNDMNAEDSDSVEGGLGYFAGGPTTGDSSAFQVIDVSAYATKIDAGQIDADIAGDFGGFLNQNDTMSLTVTFLAGNGTTILGSVTIGGVNATDRVNDSVLLHRETLSAVPTGTRGLKVELDAHFDSGAFNDAYADNIYVALEGNNLSNGLLLIETTHDYSAQSIGTVAGVSFRGEGQMTATFTGQQFVDMGDASFAGTIEKNTVVVNVGSVHGFDGREVAFHTWNDAKDRVVVNGSTASDEIVGTSRADTLNGAGGNDHIEFGAAGANGGGADIVDAGGGTDKISWGVFVSATSINQDIEIDGGSGSDTLSLDGGGTVDLTCTGATLKNIETLVLLNGNTHHIVLADGNVAAGKTLKVDAHTVVTGVADVDGSKEKDGNFIFSGSHNGDNFKGGTLTDVMNGHDGGDVLDGGGGNDRFVYAFNTDSLGTAHDVLVGFSAGHDQIDLRPSSVNVQGMDAALNAGTVNDGTFTSDLRTALQGHLTGNHAIVFTANHGDFKDHTYLVIDVNGNAGYQAGSDMVIELLDPLHLGSFSAADILD